MRVRPDLHLVYSGDGGFGLTDRYDCHAWLVDTGAGWALFDAGAGRDIPSAITAIAASGVDPATVRWLLLTHGHADHSGGAFGLAEALDLEVMAGPGTARLLTESDTIGIGLDRAIRASVYPDDYAWRGCTVDRILQPGERFALGALAIDVVASPGHSHDHVCYRAETSGGPLLLAGDALFWGGRVTWQDTADCDVAATCATIRHLAELDFVALLPGHGAFSLRDGRRHAERALRRIERLLAPDAFD